MSCSGLIPEGRLLAAFSGGEDSLYMLMLLAREAGERTEAAYVDHGIRSRAELEREIGLNRENAARLGIRLHIITLAPGAVAALAREKGIGVEAAARTLRYGALEELVGLESDDEFVLAVDVSGLVGSDRRDGLVVQRADAVILTLLFDGFETEVPDVLGSFGGTLQERGVAQIGGDVRLHETRDVDLLAPKPVDEGFVQFHKMCYCSFWD